MPTEAECDGCRNGAIKDAAEPRDNATVHCCDALRGIGDIDLWAVTAATPGPVSGGAVAWALTGAVIARGILVPDGGEEKLVAAVAWGTTIVRAMAVRQQFGQGPAGISPGPFDADGALPSVLIPKSMLGLRAVDLDKVSALLDNTKFAPDDAPAALVVYGEAPVVVLRGLNDQSKPAPGTAKPASGAEAIGTLSMADVHAAVAHLEATGAFPSRASKTAASSIETTTSGDGETPRAPDPELVDRLINGGSAPRPEATAATSTPLGRESAQIIRQSRLDDEDRAAARAAAEAAMLAEATRASLAEAALAKRARPERRRNECLMAALGRASTAEDAQHTAEVAAEEAALAAMTEASLAAAARDDAIRQERELKYHRSTRRAAVVISRALRSKLARLHAAASRAARADVAVPATISAEAQHVAETTLRAQRTIACAMRRKLARRRAGAARRARADTSTAVA